MLKVKATDEIQEGNFKEFSSLLCRAGLQGRSATVHYYHWTYINETWHCVRQ